MALNLKVASWNINGIKSIVTPTNEVLDGLNSDIICLQETKTNEDTLQYKTAIIEGYNSYFSFSQTKPGYSGVAVYCRNPLQPIAAEEGFVALIKRLNPSLIDDISIRNRLCVTVDELQSLEAEGRSLCLEFQVEHCSCGFNKTGGHSLYVVNVYCPMAEPDNVERQRYKSLFNNLLQICVESILTHGSHILLVGDLNIKHKTIDLADVIPPEVFLHDPHRHWLDALLTPSQRCPSISSSLPSAPLGRLLDTFRLRHPSLTHSYTCWNTKLNCRATNFGSRIDYILCDSAMPLTDAQILADIVGSDHCPITATFHPFSLRSSSPSSPPPPLCSSNLPRFRKQSRITSFIVRTERTLKRSSSPSSEHVEPSKKLSSSYSSSSSQLHSQWKTLFKQPREPPRCRGHREFCALRTVAKEGPNKGKKFWACSKLNGAASDPQTKCNFFQWSE